MAELANKLHIKKDDVVYDCVCYTTEEEATPTTIPGGSCWKFKNNGIECYVGLYPVSQSGGEFHTPLKIKKNNIEYYVETKVVNNYRITIIPSDNQTIKVTCNGSTHQESFDAPAGSQFTVTVTPATGYTAGAIIVNPNTNGYLTENISISAEPATRNTYLFTITQSDNQMITVVCNGESHTSSFTANYGDTWTATVTPDEGYIVGTLNKTEGTITGTESVSATSAVIKKYAINVTQPDNGSIYVNGVEGNVFTLNHGTNITIEAVPDDLYKIDALYVSDTEI